MQHPFVRIRMAAASSLAGLLLVACGGGGSSTPAPPPTPAATSGTLSIAITNRRVCDLEAVNLTIAKFRVNKAPLSVDPPASGWVDVPVSPPRKINLLNLNGELEVLGQATLEPGHYSWLTVDLDTSAMANTVVPGAGDAEQPLELPGWAQNGGYLRVNFDVVTGQKTDIVLDGNGCQAADRAVDGKRYFPTVAMVTSAPNGITGFVSPDALANHVLVTAELQIGLGSIVASTRPDPVTGEFRLLHLEPGNYNVLVTADNSAATVIGTVPVAQTATTAVSTRASPIPPAPSSKMGSISGTFTYPYYRGANVYVWASQQFAGGYGATIQYKAADVGNDTFTLSSLPLAATQYARYTGTLPLAFSASTANAGKYTLVALGSALMGTGGVNVDISAGNKTGVDIVLIPTGP